MQAQHKAAEALYKQQQAGGRRAGGASGAPRCRRCRRRRHRAEADAKPEGDVIDAEVVEDEKK